MLPATAPHAKRSDGDALVSSPPVARPLSFSKTKKFIPLYGNRWSRLVKLPLQNARMPSRRMIFSIAGMSPLAYWGDACFVVTIE